jgi:hypothetical protein
MLTNKIFLKENKTTFESGLKSSTFMGSLVFPEQPVLSSNYAAISSMWRSPIPRAAHFWPSRPTSSLFIFFPSLLLPGNITQPAVIACYCLLPATTIASVLHLHLSAAPSRFFSRHRLSILASFPVLAPQP